MWAAVTVSFLGSPPYLWDDVLGEGSSSLNYLLSPWPVYQSYSIHRVGHQWSPAYVSCLWFSRLFNQSWKMVLLMFCSGFCVMYVV